MAGIRRTRVPDKVLGGCISICNRGQGYLLYEEPGFIRIHTCAVIHFAESTDKERAA